MLQEGWQYGSKEYEDSARDAPCQSRISYAFRIQFLFVALDSVADVVASDEELLVDLVAADCSGIIRVEIAEMCIDVGLRGGRELFIYRDAAVFAVRHYPVRSAELFYDFRIASARPCLVVFFLQGLKSEE